MTEMTTETTIRLIVTVTVTSAQAADPGRIQREIQNVIDINTELDADVDIAGN